MNFKLIKLDKEESPKINKERMGAGNERRVPSVAGVSIFVPKQTGRRKDSAMIKGDDERLDKIKGGIRAGTVVYSNQHSYNVVTMVGKGGYGEVYEVEQEDTGNMDTMGNAKKNWPDCFNKILLQLYAMKTEVPKSANMKDLRLQVELTIMDDCKHVRDPARKSHFLTLIDYGRTARFNFIVMDLVSLSLEEVRKKILLGVKFSKSTAMQCGQQTLQAIVDLHALGYIHRDLKPGNYVIGLPGNESQIYMLDFGIGRKIRINGKIRKKREKTGFMGTQLFAPRASHRMEDLSFKDDLESWIYMMLELFSEVLPWAMDERGMLLNRKTQFFLFKSPDVWNYFPLGFKKIMTYIDGLKYESTPDYSLIMQSLLDIAKENSIDMTLRLDWVGKLTGGKLDSIKRRRKEDQERKRAEEKEREEREKENLPQISENDDDANATSNNNNTCTSNMQRRKASTVSSASRAPAMWKRNDNAKPTGW